MEGSVELSRNGASSGAAALASVFARQLVAGAEAEGLTSAGSQENDGFEASRRVWLDI